jgi:hypothetical protein
VTGTKGRDAIFPGLDETKPWPATGKTKNLRNRAALTSSLSMLTTAREDEMMDLIKMAVLGAVFSYSAVIAYNQPVRRLEAALSAKYPDHTPVLTRATQLRVAQH